MSNIFTNFKNLDIQKALRSEMGDLSFREREKELQSIKDFFTDIEDLNADQFLPDEKLNQLKIQYGQFLDLINNLMNFDYKRVNVNINQERENLLNNIVRIENNIFNAFHSILPYLFLKNKKYDEMFKKIDESYQVAKNTKKILVM